MIKFDNSDMHSGNLNFDFEGTPIELSAEISSLLRLLYCKLLAQDEDSAQAFKECFITCLDLAWLSDDEVHEKFTEALSNRLKEGLGQLDTIAKDDTDWFHSFDEDDDDEDEDDDEWD